MNEIRLNRLSLRDFQGGTITLDAIHGRDLFVFAANAVGKTRLVSAFTWLLFNKDALGRSDFEIKNLDAEGEAAHGLEHSVEAELSVNGQAEILKKVYKEKWAKKRGSANREFTGHTTEFYVDGVPLQEKLYIQHIIDITGDESRFRLLTSPMTFPALHWQAQRKLLLEVCGDILDEDVILSNEKLAPLHTLLGSRHTLEDHRKIVTARRSEINKEMEKIPIRIDEVRRGIPDVTGIDQKAAEKDVQTVETGLNDAKLKLQGINTGGNIADLTKKLSGINADLRKMEDAHRSESLATLNKLNQQISEVGVKVGADRRRVQTIDGQVKAKDQLVKNIDGKGHELKERRDHLQAEVFKDPTDETCPACGQALPPEQIQEARKNYLATFNSKKAERLGEMDVALSGLREQWIKADGEIDALKKESEILGLEIPSMEHKLKTLTDERDAEKGYSEDFSNLTHHVELLDEIEDLEAQIKAERDGKAQDIQKIKIEISSFEADLFLAKSKVNMFVNREQGEKRIEELKAEEKMLSKEYEKLEGELYLMEQFIKTKVSMLTDRINGKFEMVRFKLFNTLINQGIEDCCEITVNGIGYNSGLNSAGRIQAGCDIIRTLQAHFGMKAVVFVDNRESVFYLPKMECQLISLIHSPEDEVLRVEVQK